MRRKQQQELVGPAGLVGLDHEGRMRHQAARLHEQDPTGQLVRVGSRGLRGRGGGRMGYLPAPVEWRGSTQQVCGLWPHALGAGVPTIGVPLGRHLRTGTTVCCDPISWFERAGIIANPSAFIVAKPAVGKSTLVAVWALGLAAGGVRPFFLGDLKPDYADLTRALGGQVITFARAGGAVLNLLDPGAMLQAATRLDAAGHPAAAARLRDDSRARRLQLLAGVAGIARNGEPLPGHLEAVLEAALQLLDERAPDRVPVIADLVAVVTEGPEELRRILLADTFEEYRSEVRELHRVLVSLTAGAFGATFAGHTTDPIDVDAPALCVDISRLRDGDQKLLAAVLLTTWADGFSAIEAAQTLADAGLRPPGRWFVVLDELWKVLRASKGMVDRVDALTRLNRTFGVGTAYVTHSFKDLDGLVDPEDRAKAAGFPERCGLVIVGTVASADIARVHDVFNLSAAEAAELRGFSAGGHGGFDPDTGRATFAAGRGKMLLKPGDYPGIPVRVHKPSVLDQLHRTDAAWNLGHQLVGRAG